MGVRPQPARWSDMVPPGTIPVGVGLVVTGITAYGYLLLTARVLGPSRFAAVSVLWATVFLTGPGLFLPLQQEVGRLVAHRTVEGTGGGPVIRRAARAGAILAGVVLVGALAASSPIVHHLFDGQVLLFVGFVLALIGYLLLALVWGALAGAGRFRPYAVAQASDGILRIAVCALLAVAGLRTAGGYGLVLGITPIVAALLVVPSNTDVLADGPAASWSDLSGALGWLLLGSISAQLLVNASVIAVKALATHAQQAEAGHFLAGLIIARLPLFFFGAVQAALLPRLAGLARAGRHDEFWAGLWRVLALVGLIAVAAVVGAAVAGPWAVHLLFGAKYVIGRRDLVVLAAGSGVYMLAVGVVQAIIALGYHARSAVCWLVGVAAFAVVLGVVPGLLTRVEYAFLAGAVAALVAAVVVLAPHARGLAEAIDPDEFTLSLGQLEIEP